MVTKDPAVDPARMASRPAPTLTISAIHAPSLLTWKIWAPTCGEDYRSTEVAEEAEIPLVVMHPVPTAAWILALAGRTPAGLEQQTGVRSRSRTCSRCGWVSAVCTSTRTRTRELLVEHLVLDTSHAAVAGHDPSEVRRRFGHGFGTSTCRQCGKGGLPPPAGRRRPRSRHVHARA
jgi:hypothetical protein